MAKNSIRDYSATNSNNTDIQSIDISEGCSPAGINNAIREVMADLKDVSTGAVALESPAFDSASLTGDLTFGDNDKAVFGAGSDLQIYHDASDSWIVDNGTGGLKIGVSGTGTSGFYKGTGSEVIATFEPDGPVTLYHNGSAKLATTSTGVDVTGAIKAKGGSTSTQTTNAGLIANSSGKFVVNHGNEYGLYTGYINSTNDAIGIASTTNAGTAGPLVLQPFGGNVLVGCVSQVSSTVPGISTFITAGDYAFLNIGNTRTTTQNTMRFFNANGQVGSIATSGTSTSYFTSSDYRLKENVVADWDATTRLKQLNPVRFNFIADPDTTVDGFLAHEVQDIVPEAITGTKDAMRDEEYEVTPAVLDEDGNEVTPAVMGTRSVPDYQGIDQSKLVPLLVKTIQELEARITALEAN